MNPSAANLQALVGKSLAFDSKLNYPPPNNSTGTLEKAFGVTLTVNGDTVSLSRDDEAGEGLWVPYSEGKAVVGYLDGARNWVASGPFSGCQFAMGKSDDGRVFAAHIAMQSGSTAEADYKTYRTDHGLSEWYWNKIPLPNELRYSCSYLFATAGGGGIITLVRMDADVTSMGGGSGTITKVHAFKK